MDVITEYAWIAWLVLILVFVIIEILSLEFTFLMLALGGTVGLLSGLLGAPWWLQLLIAAAAALLLLLAVRPPLLRALQRGADPAKSNVDALLGMPGLVLSTVTPHDSPASSLEPGTRIVLSVVDGATAVVVPVPTHPAPLGEQKE